MNILSLPTQALIHVIGWTLLHFFWQGALVAILMSCVMSLLHGRSSQVRYIVACSALLLMAVLPLITCIHLVMVTQTHTGEFFSSTLQMPSVSSRGGVSFSEPLLDRIAHTLDRSLPLLLSVWSTGVLFVFGRLGLGLVVAHRIKSAASLPLPEELRAIFYRLARRLSIMRPVRLLNSAIVQAPTLIGWFRPVVLIPLGCLSGLSTPQIEAILVHELAHIRRHDYLVSVLQSIVEALLFYHPAVWWVSKTIRKEREDCCDDMAVDVGGNALIYARALSFARGASLNHAWIHPWSHWRKSHNANQTSTRTAGRSCSHSTRGVRNSYTDDCSGCSQRRHNGPSAVRGSIRAYVTAYTDG